jgi:hypothetical protein
VTLSWSAISGATSYRVKGGPNGGPYTQIATPTTTSYIHTGLTNNTTYYYVVSAVNSAGESDNSSQVSATPTAPPPPGTATSLSQYGITWTFDKAYPVGQFVNGDYWVIGPVTIIQILPASRDMGTRGIVHGSMLNPEVGSTQGYDSRMFGSGFVSCGFVSSLNAARPNDQDLSAQNPLVISTPASLVSGISTLELGAGLSNQVPTMAVLTILSAVPAEGSFRPPYVGTDKTIRHTMADLNMNRLPSLTMPSGLSYESFHLSSDGDPFTPSGVASKLAARFQRPWIEHMLGSDKEVFCPRANMPGYGRELASRVSDAALALTLDIPIESKRILAMRLAQYGLDTYGITQRPDGRINWKADGGHMSGRTFPLLFAGHILGDAAMLNVLEKSGQYAYQNGHYAGNLPADYVHFGEIDQTFYVTARDISLAHSEADPRTPLIQYTDADLGKPEWGILHVWKPEADNNNWDAVYRPTCGMSWSGFVLASRIMGLRNAWNHPPLFDYMDRYMQLTVGTDTRTFNPFQARMWDTYRTSY